MCELSSAGGELEKTSAGCASGECGWGGAAVRTAQHRDCGHAQLQVTSLHPHRHGDP